MSRRDRLRSDTEVRYPLLGQFLGGYLHEDWSIFSGTPEKAVDQAIAEYPVPILQQVRREQAGLLQGCDDDARLRDILNEGLGVNVFFKQPREAREFAEDVERRLLQSIKAHFQQDHMEGRTQ
jgi:hypothetical protein